MCKNIFFTPVKTGLLLNCLLVSATHAVDKIEEIEVHGQTQNLRALTGSAETLLSDQGVNFSAAGGVSSLPILNGMMGDRIKILVDGADITAACANQMNPPLSYISANQISSYSVVAGISPVSAGGDNIAGVIQVNAIDPQYTDSSSLGWQSGYLSAQYKENNQAQSYGLGARLASHSLSLDYQASFDKAESYTDGNGNLVLDTLYQSENHSLTTAYRDEKQQMVLKLSHQKIPYQGFANQYMDMVDNTSYGAIAQYSRTLTGGEFRGQLNYNSVQHEMGFFTDEKNGTMPMNTESEDISYQLNWQLDLDENSRLLLGQEFYSYRLDDWWPAVEGSMMMGPNDYVNINQGERDRLTAFAELQTQRNNRWWSSAGIRLEQVTTDTGKVQAYTDADSMMGMASPNILAADEFNALDRQKEDLLVDANLLFSYRISERDELQFGLARKNRAPNLYERYSWGQSTMATTMIGWFGDGNGYIGNPDLEAETAHSLSMTYNRSATDNRWQLSANIWYSKVSDYIDSEVVSSFNMTSMSETARNILQFTNLDATLYGAKLDASRQFADSTTAGKWEIVASLTSTEGKRDEGDETLYQIMPLQTQLGIRQELGNWQNALNWQWIDSKDQVDNRRLENQTDSYGLLNLSSRASWNNLSLSLEVSNLLDKYYQQPLGGVSVAEYRGDMTSGFSQLAGQGRTFSIGMSYGF